MSDAPVFRGLECPMPMTRHERVLLGHGGGGRLTEQLLEAVFRPRLSNPALDARHDGAVLRVNGARLAFTTDSFVVSPIFFPGGDIGSLAVHGTVNDLAMCGARPIALSAAFVLEEGFPMADLERIVASLSRAAAEAAVAVATGDTKVVERGKGDGVYITTTGIGEVVAPAELGPRAVRAGDAVIVSGPLGSHGMALMATRSGLGLESSLRSDSACVAGPALALIDAGIEVHCMRDPTRGGLSATLDEIARASRLAIEIDEPRVPVDDTVRAACEILGLDPFHIASEGRFLAFVPWGEAERAVGVMRGHAVASGACVIGRVTDGPAGRVTARTAVGSARILDVPSGEQLPRIC